VSGNRPWLFHLLAGRSCKIMAAKMKGSFGADVRRFVRLEARARRDEHRDDGDAGFRPARADTNPCAMS
jgi:hypothetical protein